MARMNVPKAHDGNLGRANQLALTPTLSRKRERGKARKRERGKARKRERGGKTRRRVGSGRYLSSIEYFGSFFFKRTFLSLT